MAATQELREQPSFRRDSPSPSASPTPAIAACPELSRCVSAGSAEGLFSGSRSVSMGGRESMASSVGSSISRSSSASYSTRQSMGGLEKPARRGYVRPQGTNFAKSAQSRESVLSLGSIMHLQYYFARTGLLDGKGGRLAKKRENGNRGTLDLSALDTSFLSPRVMGSDVDSSYASMGSSPELLAQGHGGILVESPTQDGEFFSEEDEDHPHMLPPTVSTYIHREKHIPHPPTLNELKEELHKALAEANKILSDAKESSTSPPSSPSQTSAGGNPNGWYEIEGMHILDIMTLAIRAAKMYYTAHDQPARLSAIKSERRIRTELLSVMDVLKRMATRNFANGMRTEERETMEAWVTGVYDMLSQEEELEEAERRLRASWTWLEDSWEGTNSWSGREVEREYAFMKSMDPDPDTIPEFQPVESVLYDEELPTEFLKEMRTGMHLVKLHNALVKKSKRNFGAIEKWHTDFGKPYRSAENLRYWIKAAELRWEIGLKVDVMAVVTGTDRFALRGFEDAIWRWCRKVREEISAELRV
ncbi:hypothetical protein BJ875DRAFT_57738 [Amylocarpus encephaloides]|uniref:Transcription factor SUM-1 n=1 Tax=Amylocarpus encephaloides TaxID=45428 RepID=A0A9P7YRH7_9HELO|nr:hypothetical protein BJ875DRAFT_57738 [Amylocarpus encephaloides]